MQAVLLVIDSFGIGSMPDAEEFGDAGANTALSICQGVENVAWPNLQKLGLGNCTKLLGHDLPGCAAVEAPGASFGAMFEKSKGKDTTTGHWELAGIELDQPFATFPLEFPSFPAELLDQISAQCGHKILANIGGSGIAMIEEFGARHLAGEGIIVYTSADSVLQIAAHDAVVPIDELYQICEAVRQLCDPYRIGRVIARPFTGEPGSFTRTRERRDFSMLPVKKTILTQLQEHGVETIAIGKIGDIFAEQGISSSYHDAGNHACLERLDKVLSDQGDNDRFIFVNLVDTDMLYGHRRDIQGYHDAVAVIDDALTGIIDQLSEKDLLIISADHGCDPGFKGTDHTREYVPLLSYRPGKEGKELGVRKSFSDVAASLAQFFGCRQTVSGDSFIE